MVLSLGLLLCCPLQPLFDIFVSVSFLLRQGHARRSLRSSDAQRHVRSVHIWQPMLLVSKKGPFITPMQPSDLIFPTLDSSIRSPHRRLIPKFKLLMILHLASCPQSPSQIVPHALHHCEMHNEPVQEAQDSKADGANNSTGRESVGGEDVDGEEPRA